MSNYRITPIAWATYLFPGVMGVLFLFSVQEPARLTDTTSTGWATVFAVTMLLGSVAALSGVVLGRWKPDLSLLIESVGAGVLSLELAAYTVSLIGPRPPWWTLVSTGFLALGCAGRAVQCLFQRRHTAHIDLAVAHALKRAVVSGDG